MIRGDVGVSSVMGALCVFVFVSRGWWVTGRSKYGRNELWWRFWWQARMIKWTARSCEHYDKAQEVDASEVKCNIKWIASPIHYRGPTLPCTRGCSHL